MIIKTSSLPQKILNVVQDKDTEIPFSGEYDDFAGKGTYLCRQCGLSLFRSQNKFSSGCGWPSFDEEINDAIQFTTDPDGRRTEILCKRCGAHLGHVFKGEGFTQANTRHCVNSLSLDYVPDSEVKDTEEAIYAGGCFWGLEYYFKQVPGVLKTEVGYIGGTKEEPSYEQVCAGGTKHYEGLRVLYDSSKVDFKTLTKFFFEIHDPTQANGQGPDIGEQYQSAVFYYNESQKKVALELIAELEKQGYHIVTKVLPVSPFWRAEPYHQNYYQKTGKTPYCHQYIKRFK